VTRGPIRLHRLPSKPFSIDTSKFTFLHPEFTKRRGLGIVHDSLSNKGTGFDLAERDRLRIRGLVPPRQLTLKQQMQKIKTMLDQLEGDIAKHQFLSSLQGGLSVRRGLGSVIC
jgi:hypothetical protein